MQIPRFPNILKMQKHIRALLGRHFYVVQLEVVYVEERMIAMGLTYKTNKYVDCRTGVSCLFIVTSEP